MGQENVPLVALNGKHITLVQEGSFIRVYIQDGHTSTNTYLSSVSVDAYPGYYLDCYSGKIAVSLEDARRAAAMLAAHKAGNKQFGTILMIVGGMVAFLVVAAMLSGGMH